MTESSEGKNAHFVQKFRIKPLDLHRDSSPFHVRLAIQTKCGKNRKWKYGSHQHPRGVPLSVALFSPISENRSVIIWGKVWLLSHPDANHNRLVTCLAWWPCPESAPAFGEIFVANHWGPERTGAPGCNSLLFVFTRHVITDAEHLADEDSAHFPHNDAVQGH